METTVGLILEHHADKLARRLAEYAGVENASNRYSDVHLKIGARIFYVHKFVLQINSEYFTKVSFEIGTPDLQQINPDHFLDVLRFMYTGELLVSKANIESLLVSGEILSMCDLTRLCYRFMTESLAIDNALLYWRLANKYEMKILAAACQLKVETDVEPLLIDPIGKTLLNASAEMMKILLAADNLAVKHEEEVGELLISWINEHVDAGNVIEPEELLHHIRWSGANIDFVKSKMLQNEFIQSDDASMAFLTRVVTYLQNGIQFEGLHTLRRPSTGLENCLMAVGLSDGVRMVTDICRISLSHPETIDTVLTMEKLPTLMNSQSTASTYNGTVYVTGTGSGAYKELWAYKPVIGWKKLKDMPTVRRVHCSTFVDSTLFVLGGKVENEEDILVLNSIESYNTTTNKWSTGGNLVHPVYNAACITYKNAICVFGGEDKDKMAVDYAQVYNTVKKVCVLMASMPEAYEGLRAMLFETSVILIGGHTCFIYNFDNRQWQERPQFKTEVHFFAAVLDNSTIFIAGGGTFVRDKESVKTWTYYDEIKSMSVLDIINDVLEPEMWKHHGVLPKPGVISAYVSVALPVIDKTPRVSSRPSAQGKKKPKKEVSSSEEEESDDA